MTSNGVYVKMDIMNWFFKNKYGTLLAVTLFFFLFSLALVNNAEASHKVGTLGAGNVTDTSATLWGQTAADSGTVVSVYFDWGGQGCIGTKTGCSWQVTATPATLTGTGGNYFASFTYGLTGLTPGTTYELRAVGIAHGSTVNGSIWTFTTPKKPTVTTSPADQVSSYFARLNGTANPNGYDTKAWFRYSSTNPGSCNDTFGYKYPETTATPKSLGSGTSSVSFDTTGVNFSFLRNTTYYYCAIAENSGGKGFGSIVSYTTRDVSVYVGTAPFSENTVSRGSSTTAIGIIAKHLSGGPNVGPVDFSISGLPSGVTAAFSLSSCTPNSTNTCQSNLTFSASSSATTGVFPLTIEATDTYGGVKYIYKTTYTLTVRDKPVVITKSASGITTSSATLYGQVNPNALDNTTAEFWYSATPTGSCSAMSVTGQVPMPKFDPGGGTSLVDYSAGATFLISSNTTYYYCAVASNGLGTSYGSVMSFKTSAVAAPTTYTLTASKSGTGSGTVASSPAGINCGADCSEVYNNGTSVTLTASAASGSTFTGWSGACSGGSCAVTMNSNQSATANFNANSPTTSTSPVSSVTTTGAALNGSANPNGLVTSAWFEWGTSASLSTYNTTSPTQNLGSGTSVVSYSSSLSGLSSGVTYYFRAAASNSAGTTKGTILSFTTTAAAAVGVSISPTNLTVTPGDSCVAALQPTLSWDLSSAMWFSKGWAWSSNIRWISFNSSNCDTDNDGKSNGGTGCPAAGTAMSAYSVKIDSANGNFSGYAWSSRIGWIAFGDYNADGKIDSSDESISGAPCSGNCRAKLNLSNNQVTGWARVLRYKSFGGDRGWIKLSGTATNGSTYGIYKNGNNLEGWVWGSENIGWIRFNGTNYGVAVVAPTQSAYQVQVDSEPIFPFPAEVDTGKVASSGRTYTVPSGKLNYGTTYYWRVKIWDTENSESSWVNGPSFGTAAHQYPKVDFEWTPKTPSALETVEFKDKSIVYGGTSISDWLWTFQDAICKTPAAGCETVQNPKITFNEVASKSNKSVSLKVTDSDGFSCTLNKSIPVNVKLPEIKEVAPKK